MKCLVVKAHPLSESLCSSLTRRVIDVLENAGHDVLLEDLYVEHFNASLTKLERRSYYNRKYFTQQVAPQVERLASAESIVLVFPTWWFSFPAILKGWFDRVWAPGIAYDHASNLGQIKPRLSKLRHMLVVTSLGSPWWVDQLILRQPVKKVLQTAIIRACAPNCRMEMLSLYKCERLTEKKVDDFSRRVETRLRQWPTSYDR